MLRVVAHRRLTQRLTTIALSTSTTSSSFRFTSSASSSSTSGEGNVSGSNQSGGTPKTAAAAASTPSSPSSSVPPPPRASVKATPSRQGSSSIHKLSQNTSDASAYVAPAGEEEIPDYSSARHMAYLALHGRRLWLPVVLSLGYVALGPVFAAAGTAAAVQKGLYATAAVLLQRWSVHGRSNHVKKDLRGHVCVVTGGTSGVGLYTAMQLLDMGAHVVIASKPGKEEATMAFFAANCNPSPVFPPKEATHTEKKEAGSDSPSSCAPLEQRVTFVAMDLADQLDVMAAAARIKGLFHDRIDLLVNCAGIWKEQPGLTKQNFEEHIGVNFLGPFHFTEALLPSLRRSATHHGRIVYVTCASHNGVMKGNVVQERMLLKPGPDEMQITARCYSASKLGNVYHAQSIADRRYEGIPLNKPTDLHPVDVCEADPGFCFTNLQREVAPLLGTSFIARAIRSLWIKDAYEGSQTVVNCCVRDDVENGGYYAECTLMPSGLSRRSLDRKSRDEVVRWGMAKTIAKYYTTK